MARAPSRWSNIGQKPVPSKNRLLTTVAYQIAGKRSYALEGRDLRRGSQRAMAA